MLPKLCADGHSECKRPKGRKHHTGRIWNSCLKSRQHFPHPSAPGLSVLLSLPRVGGWLRWAPRQRQGTPAPAADCAGSSWSPGGRRWGWTEGCSEGWVRGLRTSSPRGFQLAKEEEDDWEEETKASLLAGRGWRRTDLFAKSGGRPRGLPLR